MTLTGYYDQQDRLEQLMLISSPIHKVGVLIVKLIVVACCLHLVPPLAERVVILDDGSPIDALKWWIQQKRAGNTHGGLLQMALDVLRCPATSVDVEHTFLFGCHYVTQKRHCLNSILVTRGMSIAFYSKNKLIEPGLLKKWKDGLKEEKEELSNQVH
ncbi:hypothetical protein PSTG_10874 [Puccinia striiformis f. sp. tritici PST-78]|uniref:HAT C-terminal dimerisation domain-containing protein n=1 Tax=Puccinia striiformis f. sp. tritici PST-78 TaxID=1165861 RepID=A0A0L0VA10_9BASI|nr:hypothetical protein PSTG_10874 [Puccinia striiformis f. sp. tritici PST-78]